MRRNDALEAKASTGFARIRRKQYFGTDAGEAESAENAAASLDSPHPVLNNFIHLTRKPRSLL